MFLVDTSVWIGYLRPEKRAAQEPSVDPVGWFEDILEHRYPYGITSVIYQEILQGAASEEDFTQLLEYLSTLDFFDPLDPLESYEAAARLYYRCRRAGITIRSTIDCLIAQVAIEHDLLLLHNDRDFDFIASVVPELRLYSGLYSQGSGSSEIHESESTYGSS